MRHLRVGLIGAGVFGGYHADKISGSRKTVFAGIYDPDADRCTRLAEGYQTQSHSSLKQLLAHCDAVIVASPAVYHEDIVGEAIGQGCHVMVEKPLALTGAGADRLAEQARLAGVILQVGHQERFVLAAMGLFSLPERPRQIQTWRMSPPSPENRAGDVSVIWDLMIHDLDMVARLMGRPSRVEASGRCVHTEHLDDAEANLTFAAGGAQLRASRCADARDRRMILTYPSGHITLDFLRRTVENTTPFPIISDVSDQVSDPLERADESFFSACLGEGDCAIPGHEAAMAVHLAEQADCAALSAIGN